MQDLEPYEVQPDRVRPLGPLAVVIQGQATHILLRKQSCAPHTFPPWAPDGDPHTEDTQEPRQAGGSVLCKARVRGDRESLARVRGDMGITMALSLVTMALLPSSHHFQDETA